MNRTYYTVIKQTYCTEELGEYTTYGIQATCGSESELIGDITTERARAEEIADSFNSNALSIIHFREAVEDALC